MSQAAPTAGFEANPEMRERSGKRKKSTLRKYGQQESPAAGRGNKLRSVKFAADVQRHRRIVGERIRYYRLERGLSQRGLAEDIGASVASISLWERGGRTLSIDHVYIFSVYFNVAVRDFFFQ